MHPLVDHILRVCREHDVHPVDMSRDRFRELTDEPIVGLKIGSANFISWNEGKRRAAVAMVDERSDGDPCIPVIPEGQELSGLTTATRNARGEVTYVKTKAKKKSEQDRANELQALATSLRDLTPPRDWRIDLPSDPGPENKLNIHVFGDPHFGMRADGEETGSYTWGLAEAVRAHDAALRRRRRTS